MVLRFITQMLPPILLCLSLQSVGSRSLRVIQDSMVEHACEDIKSGWCWDTMADYLHAHKKRIDHPGHRDLLGWSNAARKDEGVEHAWITNYRLLSLSPPPFGKYVFLSPSIDSEQWSRDPAP